MKNFVGIDLGTTNSVICSYDGSETHVWKTPGDERDVTPSAILIGYRGNKYLGARAYDNAPWQHQNAVVLFKRLMGTSTPIKLSAAGRNMTPEECSAEILKLLYGYLPEEMRNTPDIGTVITVPAAFNQMQKDATMQAANMAGIGKVALMQEPVAAVMSVMRIRNADGMFLIYDLGGGTLDIAIAESIGGRVNLLAHGGIAMCGGRDFDRLLLDNIVKPWLFENFDLPDNFSANPKFETHKRASLWATEKAKIELSAKEDTTIFLTEEEMRCKDLSGNDIYLEVPLTRRQLDQLIAEKISETLDAARETLDKAGLSPHDLDHIVFVGGPTNYKPLRDEVAHKLGIPGSTGVNPMTAVAEGASIFAESIDWSSKNRSRKDSRGQISSGRDLGLTFDFIARTPDIKSKIVAQVTGEAPSGFEFQIDSVVTGWTSGRLPLEQSATIEVALTKPGENIFKVFVFNSIGSPVGLEQDKIVITRTAATVDAIPASHSVGIEVLEKLGGRPVLDYLIRSGDALPKKGKKVFKAAESLKAGASNSLNFKLWEGDIENPLSDNRPIGVLKISGSDFDDGVIPVGADLECDYEILDSGNIIVEVSVPCIGSTFHSGKNFYSRQEGQLDYTSASAMVVEEGNQTIDRIDKIGEIVDSKKLDEAREKLEPALLLNPEEAEAEKTQEAMEKVLEARRLLAQVRKEYIKEVRQVELNGAISNFNEHVHQHARASEATAFNNMAKTAQRCIDRNDSQFEYYLDEMKTKSFQILWRQDWFVIGQFKYLASKPHLFVDQNRFRDLVNIGMEFVRTDDIEKLREVLAQLLLIQIGDDPGNEMFDIANIVKG